jgi:DNA-binding Lrp family transcriptional regulator
MPGESLMDITDKNIIQLLLKDGRIPQKRIADELKISPQALKYRLNKLIEDGVIKKFVLHVNPEFYGNTQVFAAFVTDHDYTDDIFSRFRCLEDISIFGFQGNNKNEIERILKKAYEKLGPPFMNYTPPLSAKFTSVSDLDRKVIEALKENPRMAVASMAKQLSISSASAKRRILRLKERRIASVIPILDLSKTDAVIFLLFSNKPELVMPVIETSLIFQISDKNGGIAVCFSESLEAAKRLIVNARKSDEKSRVMVVYDYDFLN